MRLAALAQSLEAAVRQGFRALGMPHECGDGRIEPEFRDVTPLLIVHVHLVEDAMRDGGVPHGRVDGGQVPLSIAADLVLINPARRLARLL